MEENEELREEDVTREDNLDDKVSEGETLPPGPAGTAEGEDSSTGEGPASADPSTGQDAPENDG